MKSILRPRAVLAAGLLATFLAACSKAPPATDGRTVQFYQSPMHPWITSKEPGQCTICGMDLVPVYEGQAQVSSDVLPLSDVTVRALGVQTAPAERRPLRRTLRFTGIFDDNETDHRIVAAFYDGRIERVYIDHVGQYVEKGAPLAAIYSPELLYVVREFQEATQGNRPDVARVAARRLVQFGLAPEQVTALSKQREPAYTVDLLAPISGTILVREAYQGQYIKTGEPLFEMGNLARMWFHAEVYERDLPGVRVGQSATLTSPTAPGQTFPGTVTLIDPNFDPVTRSTEVRIEVDNPPLGGAAPHRRVLAHRVYGEAELTADLGEALVVPRSAVLRDGSRSLVYVERAPGAYEARPVVVGRLGDDGLEIVEGLEPGDRVVTQGNLMIDAEAQLRGNVSHQPAAPAEHSHP